MSDLNIYDVFPVTVGSLVQPASPIQIHLGGMVNFVVTNDLMQGPKERWFSDNSHMLEVDSVSGVATALKIGSTNVQLKDIVNYTSNVHIFRINKAVLGNDAPHFYTNIASKEQYKEEYKVHVRFFSDSDEIFKFNDENGQIDNNLHFECEVDEFHRDMVVVNGEIATDSKTGQQAAYCFVKLKTAYPENFRFREYIIMTVKLQTNNKVYTWEHDFNLKALWGFKSVQKDLNVFF